MQVHAVPMSRPPQLDMHSGEALRMWKEQVKWVLLWFTLSLLTCMHSAALILALQYNLIAVVSSLSHPLPSPLPLASPAVSPLLLTHCLTPTLLLAPLLPGCCLAPALPGPTAFPLPRTLPYPGSPLPHPSLALPLQTLLSSSGQCMCFGPAANFVIFIPVQPPCWGSFP